MSELGCQTLHQYSRITEALGLRPFVSELILGQIPRLSHLMEYPPACYGFPPALVPFWSYGPFLSYTGLWKHWFGKRNVSFVRFGFQEEQFVTEIARDESQFVLVIMAEHVAMEDRLTEGVEIFGKRCGFTDFSEVEKLALDSSYRVEDSTYFRGHVPLSLAMKYGVEYSGDFPYVRDGVTVNIGETCSYEMPDEGGEVRHPQATWLADFSRQHSRFNELLDQGNLSGAWLCLNSHGWDLPAGKKAIERLAKAARDPLFQSLANAWREIPEELSLLE